MRIFLLGIRRPDFGLNSTEKMTLFQVGCQRWAARKGKKKKAGPVEDLAQKHSKALLNFKTFIVYKYI
jgi:hypothetical protein